MTGTHNLGDNYTFEEDSNGNLLIKDSSGSAVMKHTDGGAWSLETTDLNNVKALDVEKISNGEQSSIAQYDYPLSAGEKRALDPEDSLRPSVYIVYTNTGRGGIVSTDTVNPEDTEVLSFREFSNTEGADSLNVYYDGTNDRFEIENGETFNLNVSVTRFGFESTSVI